MNFELLCVFAAMAVVVSTYPYDSTNLDQVCKFSRKFKKYNYIFQPETQLDHEVARHRRSPDDNTPDPEFKFKAKVEDSKQDGRSL